MKEMKVKKMNAKGKGGYFFCFFWGERGWGGGGARSRYARVRKNSTLKGRRGRDEMRQKKGGRGNSSVVVVVVKEGGCVGEGKEGGV